MFQLNGTKLLVIGNAFFGIGTTLTKFILFAVPAGPFLILRHLISGLTLLMIAKSTGRWRSMSWSDLRAVGLIGLINISLGNILFVVGLQMVPATHALLIALTGPVMVYVLSHLLLKEHFDRQALIGMLIIISGIMFLLVGQWAQFGATERLGGVILLLLSTLASSYGVVRAKRVLVSIEPIQMTAWQLIIGSIPFIVIWGWELITFDWLSLSMGYIWAFFIMVLVVSPISFGAFYLGLSTVKVSSSASLMYAQTIVGNIFAVLVFGENLTTVYLISMAIIMFGIWIGRVEFSRTFSMEPLLRMQARLRALGRFAFHKHGEEYHFFKSDMDEV